MSLKNIYTCFPGGKHKALTFSFDDGRVEDRRLVELFNQYGMKGTFNLNSGLHNAERIPVSEYKELYSPLESRPRLQSALAENAPGYPTALRVHYDEAGGCRCGEFCQHQSVDAVL